MRGLYLITDEKLTPYDQIEKQITPLLPYTAILQFRDKNSSDALKESTAKKLHTLCKLHQTRFLINDDVDLARHINADGVHIGRDDEDMIMARRILGPDKVIGVSCYGDLFRAKEMEHRGANYVAFGACFASITKPHAPTISLEVIKEAKRLLNLPIWTIGGITLENAPQLIEQGSDLCAVISDIWCAKSPILRAQAYHSLFEQEGHSE